MSRILAVLLLVTPLAAPAPLELDFEGAGGRSAGWRWNEQDPVFSASLSLDCRTEDTACAAVWRERRGSASDYGYVLRSIDATELRGRTVRFQAWVRLEAPSVAGAELFLRVDRPSGGGVRRQTRLRSTEWSAGELVAEVDEDAVRVTVGMMFRGLGTAWLADAELETID